MNYCFNSFVEIVDQFPIMSIQLYNILHDNFIFLNTRFCLLLQVLHCQPAFCDIFYFEVFFGTIF